MTTVGRTPPLPDRAPMTRLELKIPPVVAFLVAAILIGALSPIDGPTVDGVTRWIVAGIAAAIGLAFIVPALGRFQRAETTVHPQEPWRASTLVTTGVYRRTRNPMYLGLSILLISVAAAFGSVLGLAPVAVFVGFITRFQIRPEERFLTATFGDAYADYRRRVRRWI